MKIMKKLQMYICTNKSNYNSGQFLYSEDCLENRDFTLERFLNQADLARDDL